VREAIRQRRKSKLQTSASPVDAPGGGAIIVGRASWIEFINGLQEGCSAPLEDPPPTDKTPSDDSLQVEAGADPASTTSETGDWASSPKDDDTFSVPQLEPVGFVHFYNRIGWKNFPLRIFHGLTSYKNFDLVGEEAVKIVLGNTKSFDNEDLALGKDEERFFRGEFQEPQLDERIANRLSVYT
jgi:hypothetical protein